MNKVHVCSYSQKLPDDAIVINTTSRSNDFGRGLSPFLLGPVNLYGGFIARNVENAWQYSKVYAEHTDEEGLPSESYWEWAKAGWRKYRADRYPMGKGVKPLFSWWDGQKLTYIEARSAIYIPIYGRAVVKTKAYQQLKKIAQQSEIYLRDFDGYDNEVLGMSFDEVKKSETRKMGHAFVLKMLLDGYIAE